MLVTASFLFLIPSILEDYAVIYLGSSVFKIVRLLLVALLSVHYFACIFFAVKRDTAMSDADVAAFYGRFDIGPQVASWFSYSE